MKSRFREFAVMSFLLVLARSSDCAATYYYSPDLKFEANPLVSIFGLGWTAIMSTNLLIIAAVLVLLYLSARMTGTYPQERNLSFRRFAALFWFERERPLFWIIMKMPKNRQTGIRVMAYDLSRLIIASSFAMAIYWWIAPRVPLARTVYSLLYPYGLLGLVGAAAVGFQFLFLRREYLIYKGNSGL